MATTHSTTRHLIVEVRYKPSLAVYGLMDKIGIAFSNDYPDWERTPLTLELYSKQRKRRCHVAHRRCFFEAFNFDVDGPEFDHAAKFVDKVHHELKFTEVVRLGIRRLVLLASDKTYAQMVSNVTAKFHIKSDDLNGILQGKVEDNSFVADVQSDLGWKYTLRLGPMKPKQWFETVPYDLKMFSDQDEFEKYRKGFPDQFYYIDIDCFKENIAFSDVKQLTLSIQPTSSTIVDNLAQYLRK